MAIKEIKLPYGKKETSFNIEEKHLLKIINPKVVSGVDEIELIRNAFVRPIASPLLRELVKPRDKVIILIDDNTRLTPVQKILPFVFEELKLSGVKDGNVLILIAGGTHRPMTKREIRLKVGDSIQKKYNIVNHNWKDEDSLTKIGVSPAGFPIEVNRLAVEADICIGIGDISPHSLCGWSGGGKLVEPGICGARTTDGVHGYQSNFGVTFLGLDENPIRREIDFIAKKAGLRFIINTVLDGEGKIANVFAGGLISAHRKGIQLAKTIWADKIKAFADIVIASSYPCDIDFWQVHKTLAFMAKAVRRGGDMILVTPCPEGLSGEEKHKRVFKKYGCYPSKEIFKMARKNEEDDFTGLGAVIATVVPKELADITIVSHGLTGEDCKCLGFNHEESIEGALQKCLEKNGPDAKVIVMPHGPKVIPIYE